MKKLICLLLSAMMIFGLAACGGDAPSSSDNNALLPQSTDTPAPISEPLQEDEVYLERAMLTGLEKDADYPEGVRCTGVMINNIASARPANGTSDAKVLVEIVAEGGITRFMGIYEDYRNLPRVGSIRSARDQFLQLLIPFWGFYVHEGPHENQPVIWMLNDYDYGTLGLDITRSGYGNLLSKQPERNGKTYSWFNVDGDSMSAAVDSMSASDFRDYRSPMFDFVPYNEPARTPTGGNANEVGIVHSASYRTLFNYNSSTQKYDMSMWNSSRGMVEETVDANNNERLSFENVLVIFAPISVYPGSEASDLRKVDYSVGGGGYYISQGSYEPLIWRKGAANMPLRLENIDGSEVAVQMNPGKTYIAVVDDRYIEDFDASLKSGSGSAEVASGDVNANEVDIVD